MAVKNGYDWTFEEAQELNNHSQAKALTPEGREIYVDAALENLLTELWKLGYETLYSCEGGPATGEKEDEEYAYFGYLYFEESSMGFSFLDVINQEITEFEDRLFYFDDPRCRIMRFEKSMIPAFERAVRNHAAPI